MRADPGWQRIVYFASGDSRFATDCAIFEPRPAGAMATSAHGRSLNAVRRIVDGRARAVNT